MEDKAARRRPVPQFSHAAAGRTLVWPELLRRDQQNLCFINPLVTVFPKDVGTNQGFSRGVFSYLPPDALEIFNKRHKFILVSLECLLI